MFPFRSVSVLPLALISLSTSSLAVSSQERPDGPPAGFTTAGVAPQDEILTLRLALKPGDFAGLEKIVYEVSDPGSVRHGQYLSKTEVEKYIAPSEETLTAVKTWLDAHGLESTNWRPSQDLVSVKISVSKANELFSANFTKFEHTELDSSVVRTLAYSLPEGLEDYITMVHPTTSFPFVPSDTKATAQAITTAGHDTTVPHVDLLKRERGQIPESCVPDGTDDGIYFPYRIACFFDMYALSKEPAKRQSNVWLTGISNSFVNKGFLEDYMESARPDVPSSVADFDLVTIDGGLNNQLPIGAGFATGYMELIAGTGTNVSTTFLSIGTDTSDDLFDWFMDEANFLLNMDQPPQVVVLAGGNRGELHMSRDLAGTLCNAYAQLAARGVSLIAGVGVAGVGGPLPVPARNCTIFDVAFPASCPYVTSVGGTHTDNGATVETAERYTNGGFSTFFARPAYQDKVAQAYIDALNGQYDGLYNKTGRGVPDLALLDAADLNLGIPGVVFGTPDYAGCVFAGLIGLLNDQRISAGKSTLGFLNPWIYSNMDAFTDVAAGNNPGCGTPGFNATAGWDPITGVGSPWYPALQKAAQF